MRAEYKLDVIGYALLNERGGDEVVDDYQTENDKKVF